MTYLAVEHTRALSDGVFLCAQAILLMLLFLFQYAIQVLHEHELEASNTESSLYIYNPACYLRISGPAMFQHGNCLKT